MRSWRTRRLLVAACSAAMFGCGGDDGGSGPPPPDEDPLVAAVLNGDDQSAPAGEALPEDLRVVITRADEPEAGVDVAWATAQGGSLDPATSVTDADGIASATWTLGPDAGAQVATATVADAEGSPVTFSATAEGDEPPPPPPADVTIEVLGPTGGNRFEPATVTIQAGETVAWIWPQGSLAHNVVPDEDEPETSGPVANGPREYRYTFDSPGVYDYFCANHGNTGGVGMSGTVIVE